MNTEQQQYLWQKIKPIRVAMLCSQDGGELRSRPIYLAQQEFQGILWFFTRVDAHKADEMMDDQKINLSFMDIERDEYISVSGDARRSQNQQVIEQLWSPMVEAWFPEGKRSDSVALLKVHVSSAEVWDAQEGKMKQLLAILAAKITGSEPQIGEHARIY